MIGNKLIPAAATLALCAALTAAPSYAMNFYVGGSLGQSKVDDVGENDLNDGSLSGITSDDTDTAWKLYGGVQMGNYVALEGSYVNFGESTVDATSDGSVTDGFASGPVHAQVEPHGFTMEVLGMYPFASGISAYVRMGLLLSEIDEKITDSSGTLLDITSDVNRDFTYGFGARYKFAERYSIRAEWQRFGAVGGGSDVGSSDIDALTVGADISF